MLEPDGDFAPFEEAYSAVLDFVERLQLPN